MGRAEQFTYRNTLKTPAQVSGKWGSLSESDFHTTNGRLMWTNPFGEITYLTLTK